MIEKKDNKLVKSVIDSTNKVKESINRVFSADKLKNSVDMSRIGIKNSIEKVNETTEEVVDKITEGTKDVVDMIKDADIKEAALLLSGLLLL